MSKKIYIYPILSACALFLNWGCGKNEAAQPLKPAQIPSAPAPDYVVAMANGTPLTWEDMDRRGMGYLNDEKKTNHLIIPESRVEEAKDHFRKRAVKAFVFKTLMMEAATKGNIKVTAKDRVQGIERLATSLKSRNWTTNDFFNNGPMPPAVMHKEFEDSLIIDKFVSSTLSSKITLEPGAVDKAIVSITATNELRRVQIEGLRQQLLDGANFEELAKKYSACPLSAKKGGDLGEFGRGKMVKPVDDAAFSQKIGEIGPVFRSPYGYHIVKVATHTQKKEATDSTPEIPETVRASHILIPLVSPDKRKITDELKKELFEKESRNLYRSLLDKADVKCFLYEDMQF